MKHLWLDLIKDGEEFRLHVEICNIQSFAYRHTPHTHSPDLTSLRGVMGNIPGTNYREPTGGDWGAFCGLTFDCCVNGRIKIFKLLPEEKNKKKEKTETGYIYRTCYCFLHLFVCAYFKTSTFF